MCCLYLVFLLFYFQIAVLGVKTNFVWTKKIISSRAIFNSIDNVLEPLEQFGKNVFASA